MSTHYVPDLVLGNGNIVTVWMTGMVPGFMEQSNGGDKRIVNFKSVEVILW